MRRSTARFGFFVVVDHAHILYVARIKTASLLPHLKSSQTTARGQMRVQEPAKTYQKHKTPGEKGTHQVEQVNHGTTVDKRIPRMSFYDIKTDKPHRHERTASSCHEKPTPRLC